MGHRLVYDDDSLICAKSILAISQSNDGKERLGCTKVGEWNRFTWQAAL
jgi:hypothetical protein